MIYKVCILNEKKDKLTGEFRLLKKPVSLESNIENEIFNVQAEDYFECLVKLREILEKRKWLMLCNGSRFDVYPSGMLREMGDGINAYQLTLGKQAKSDSLVNIFDEAEIGTIGTVEEQRIYFEKWLESLGMPPRQ